MATDSAGNIFVVDDDRFVLESVTTLLNEYGFSVRAFSSGHDAIKRFIMEPVDLVLTDINMPVMDGLKLIAHVRAEDSPHKLTPIVVISTESAPEDRRRALALGANAYLVKPLRANSVLETVKQLLEIP